MKTSIALGELTGQTKDLGFSNPKTAEHFQRMAAEQEQSRAARANAIPVTPELIVARRKAVEAESNLVDGSLPLIDKFSAYKVASAAKAKDPAVQHLKAWTQRAWENDRTGSFTVGEVKKMMDFYDRQFGKKSASAISVIRDGFAHASFAQLPVRKLAKLVDGITTQAELEYTLKRAGLAGDRPDQVKARRFILATLNRVAQPDLSGEGDQFSGMGTCEQCGAQLDDETSPCSICGAMPTDGSDMPGVEGQDTGLNVPVTMQLENFGGEQAPPFDEQDAQQARKQKNSQPMQQPVPEMMPATASHRKKAVNCPKCNDFLGDDMTCPKCNTPVKVQNLSARRKAQATPEPGKADYEPAIEGQPDDKVKVEAVLRHVVAGKTVQSNGFSLSADFEKDQIVLRTPSGAVRTAPVYAMNRVALDFVRVAQKSPNFSPKVNAQQPAKVKLPGSGGGGVLGDDSGADPKLDGEFKVPVSKRPKNKVTPSKPGPDTGTSGLQHFDVANRGPHPNLQKGKMSDEDIWGDTGQEGLQPFDIQINQPQSK